MKKYTAFVVVVSIVGGAAINFVASFFLLFLAFATLGAFGIDMTSPDILTDEFLKKIIFASYFGIMMHVFNHLRKYNKSHARSKNSLYEAIIFFGVPIALYFSPIGIGSSMKLCIGLTALGFYERIAIRYKGFGLYRYK